MVHQTAINRYNLELKNKIEWCCKFNYSQFNQCFFMTIFLLILLENPDVLILCA